MIRRGFMAAVAGLAASPLLRATAPAPAALVRGQLGGIGGAIEQARPNRPGYDLSAKFDLLDALERPARRRRRQREMALALTGGWPPHIAVMESNALWFRANRAAAWIEAREREDSDIMTRLRRQVFGDDA